MKKGPIKILSVDKIGIKSINANFATPTNPWVKRGGSWNNGTGAGLFNFNRNNGHANNNNSARSVLAYYGKIYLIIVLEV